MTKRGVIVIRADADIKRDFEERANAACMTLTAWVIYKCSLPDTVQAIAEAAAASVIQSAIVKYRKDKPFVSRLKGQWKPK